MYLCSHPFDTNLNFAKFVNDKVKLNKIRDFIVIPLLDIPYRFLISYSIYFGCVIAVNEYERADFSVFNEA